MPKKKLDSRFRWDLTEFDYPEPPVPAGLRIRYATVDEFPSIACVWRNGTSEEQGGPWNHLLHSWTPRVVERWFRHHHDMNRAKTIVAEKEGRLVGVSGPLFGTDRGIGRIFAGIVVAKQERRQGIGTALLHRTLCELRRMNCSYAMVETLHDITASNHLYPKFGGIEIVRREGAGKRKKRPRDALK